MARGDLGRAEQRPMGKFQTYQKKSFENNLMVLIEGIPLSSGEGPGVGPIVLIFFLLTFKMITP
jgi:hypothetical protein